MVTAKFGFSNKHPRLKTRQQNIDLIRRHNWKFCVLIILGVRDYWGYIKMHQVIIFMNEKWVSRLTCLDNPNGNDNVDGFGDDDERVDIDERGELHEWR